MTINFKLELFDALVCSALQYACEILDRVEAKASKLAARVGERVSITGVRLWFARRPRAPIFWKLAYQFLAMLAGLKSGQLEHHVLTAAWDMYVMHSTGMAC